MTMYQRIPHVVEARQHLRYDDLDETLDAGFELADWCGGDFDIIDKKIILEVALGGFVFVEHRGWIIKDADGEFYAYSDQEFKRDFVEVETTEEG